MATPMCPRSDDSMKVAGDESQHLTEMTDGVLKRFQINGNDLLMIEMVLLVVNPSLFLPRSEVGCRRLRLKIQVYLRCSINLVRCFCTRLYIGIYMYVFTVA